jgi:hypothetical protein
MSTLSDQPQELHLRTNGVLFLEPALMAQASIDLHELTQREYPYGFTTELEATLRRKG